MDDGEAASWSSPPRGPGRRHQPAPSGSVPRRLGAGDRLACSSTSGHSPALRSAAFTRRRSFAASRLASASRAFSSPQRLGGPLDALAQALRASRRRRRAPARSRSSSRRACAASRRFADAGIARRAGAAVGMPSVGADSSRSSLPRMTRSRSSASPAAACSVSPADSRAFGLTFSSRQSRARAGTASTTALFDSRLPRRGVAPLGDGFLVSLEGAALHLARAAGSPPRTPRAPGRRERGAVDQPRRDAGTAQRLDPVGLLAIAGAADVPCELVRDRPRSRPDALGRARRAARRSGAHLPHAPARLAAPVSDVRHRSLARRVVDAHYSQRLHEMVQRSG